VAVAFKHPNVFVSPDVWHFVPGAGAYIDAANTFMADQLLFATAYPFRPLKLTVDAFKALPLKPESLEKALYKNASRLLRI
jgi:predicted TIM-barrel fold metal-dependent hydrolase